MEFIPKYYLQARSAVDTRQHPLVNSLPSPCLEDCEGRTKVPEDRRDLLGNQQQNNNYTMNLNLELLDCM